MLNLAAALFYAIAAALCLRSGIASFRSAETPGRAGFWIVCAICFVGFIAMRLYGVEEMLRGALRQMLRADGIYATRHGIQAPVAIAVLLGVSAFAALFLLHVSRTPGGRRARAVHRAILALLAMGGLIALRIISFHGTDALLYQPLRLNWIIDIGATAVVGWSAHAYRVALAQRLRHDAGTPRELPFR